MIHYICTHTYVVNILLERVHRFLSDSALLLTILPKEIGGKTLKKVFRSYTPPKWVVTKYGHICLSDVIIILYYIPCFPSPPPPLLSSLVHMYMYDLWPHKKWFFNSLCSQTHTRVLGGGENMHGSQAITLLHSVSNVMTCISFPLVFSSSQVTQRMQILPPPPPNPPHPPAPLQWPPKQAQAQPHQRETVAAGETDCVFDFILYKQGINP